MGGRALLWLGCAMALSGCVGAGPPPPAPDPAETARQAGLSLWGVVPSAPARKADLQPDLITGSAVAISDDMLLTSCQATGGGSRVGLVRHNKYRIARVSPDPLGNICRLRVTEGPLNPIAGYRDFADLRVGEPVTALTNRTSAELMASPGWLAGKGSADDPFLEASAAVPADTGSAVLIDGFGNLIGLGATGPIADSALLAVPIGPRVANVLARREFGVTPGAVGAPPTSVPPPILLVLREDGRQDRGRSSTIGTTASADPPASGGSGGDADGGSGPSSGSPGTNTGSGNPGAGVGGQPGTSTGGGPATGGGSVAGPDPSPSPGPDPTAGGADPPAASGGTPGGNEGVASTDNRGRGRGHGHGGDGDNRGKGGDGGGRGRGGRGPGSSRH